MSLAGTLRATFSPDIGIDLGTANTVVYSHDEGVLVSEPSVVAYRTSDDALIAIGQAAKELDGRAPGRVSVVRPLRGGTISDFRGAHALVKTVVDRALARGPRVAPRVIACVPGCATDIECKAVEEAIRAAGPRTTTFVPQAVAAAVGAGLDITGTRPAMVIDIGGGTTEIAVLTLTGVVAMHSLKVGGDTFDAAIISRLRQEYFAIGPLTAERLKIERGFAGRPPGREPYTVAGTDMQRLRPGKRAVDEALLAEAMRDGIDRIARAAWSILEATPPDLAGELVDAGIVLTGGGALIPGLAGEISVRTNVPTRVADDPLGCVARGAGEILASPGLLERLRPHADRLTRWYQSLRIGMRESYS
ncbi:MAG: rod shape-determining protein [Candidatus Eremiobacteraeota bacterium]|nr:rod shape-determining protein [Candidatus Eremiobacteraeota bacterium]MBV8642746.1 rod shape-determining protein [Candidatus Eremiobacteraeota bacterium]